MAHYRQPTLWHTLGAVPNQPSIGEQLADALEAEGVSQKELARRLAAIDGGGVESKRRWILKLLSDDVARPDMAGVESALRLPPGHFRLPSLPEQEHRRVRLAELEGRVAELEQFLNVLVPRIDQLVGQVDALSKQAPSKRAPASRRAR